MSQRIKFGADLKSKVALEAMRLSLLLTIRLSNILLTY